MADVANHGQQPSYFAGNEDVFMVYPVSEHSLYCYGHVGEASDAIQSSEESAADLRKTFKDYGGIVPACLVRMEPDKLIDGRMLSVESTVFTNQRTVFIGDASHGCTPMLQQGAASAFEDVACLAAQLAEYDMDDALARYERLRKTRASWVVKTSDRPLKLMKHMNNPALRFVRDNMIRLLGPINVRGWKRLATDSSLK